MSRERRDLFLAVALWLAAFAAIRLQFVFDLRLDFATARSLGLFRGLAADALLLLAAWLPSFPVRDVPRPRALAPVIGTLLSTAAWLVTLANLFYFRFFDAPLEWWVVRMHAGDLGIILRNVNGLTPSVLVVLSVLLAGGAVAFGLRSRPSSRPRGLIRRLVRDLSLLVIVFALFAAFFWRRWSMLSESRPGNAVDDSVIARWVDAWTAGSRLLPQLPGAAVAASDADPTPAWTTLSRYRDFGAPATPVPPWAPHDPADPPLLDSIAADPAATAAARRTLGLPESGPVDVVVIFVESFRYLEFGDPATGPFVFPRLQPLIASHGLLFSQAYSSSLEAGESARGQFSTLCSYPDVVGPAVMLTQPYLKTRCLPEVLRAAGYHTMTGSVADASFHNMGLFGKLHGITDYYDKERLTGLGARERLGGWEVIPDDAILRTIFPLIDADEKAGRTFFMTIATGGTHFPVSEEKGGELPAAVMARADHAPDPRNYRGYLSRFRLADEALGPFIERLFAEPNGGRLLVVLLGDHSTGVAPPGELGDAARSEYHFRIVLSLLTRDMPHPGVRHEPVHQYDVAPTLARIAGVPAKTTWVGRDMLAGAGVPWFYLTDGVRWRLPDRGCWTARDGTPSCHSIPAGKDPLYDADLPPIPEDKPTREFFRSVGRAASSTIRANRIPGAAP